MIQLLYYSIVFNMLADISYHCPLFTFELVRMSTKKTPKHFLWYLWREHPSDGFCIHWFASRYSLDAGLSAEGVPVSVLSGPSHRLPQHHCRKAAGSHPQGNLGQLANITFRLCSCFFTISMITTLVLWAIRRVGLKICRFKYYFSSLFLFHDILNWMDPDSTRL